MEGCSHVKRGRAAARSQLHRPVEAVEKVGVHWFFAGAVGLLFARRFHAALQAL